MMQHILALLTVTLVVGWGVYRAVRFFRNREGGCGCGCCGKDKWTGKKK